MIVSEDEVAPNTDGGWDVTADGASRASSHHQTQEAVHAEARRLAENAGGGEVRIHGRDGQIRKSDTTVPPRG
jgi:hypothetical protein